MYIYIILYISFPHLTALLLFQLKATNKPWFISLSFSFCFTKRQEVPYFRSMLALAPRWKCMQMGILEAIEDPRSDELWIIGVSGRFRDFRWTMRIWLTVMMILIIICYYYYYYCCCCYFTVMIIIVIIITIVVAVILTILAILMNDFC